jgi:hypothetical protein
MFINYKLQSLNNGKFNTKGKQNRALQKPQVLKETPRIITATVVGTLTAKGQVIEELKARGQTNWTRTVLPQSKRLKIRIQSKLRLQSVTHTMATSSNWVMYHLTNLIEWQ